MKNKKKKQLPLLLLALLFITTAAYGTRAYFSDNASQDAEIELTLGNLDIESEGVVWKYITEEGSLNQSLSNQYDPITKIMNVENIQDVQPGDSFQGIFTFENVGSLSQRVSLNNDIAFNNDIFEITVNKEITNINSDITQEVVTLEPNGKIEIVATVNVKVENEFNQTHNRTAENILSNGKIIGQLNDALEVAAVQTNSPE